MIEKSKAKIWTKGNIKAELDSTNRDVLAGKLKFADELKLLKDMTYTASVADQVAHLQAWFRLGIIKGFERIEAEKKLKK